MIMTPIVNMQYVRLCRSKILSNMYKITIPVILGPSIFIVTIYMIFYVSLTRIIGVNDNNNIYY